ncbi:PH domain-containing protein [Frankia sp. Cppng1_Ct_nod]|uniref:PH domain-containing protein n=1 Tax=Frankia sp. Cppng1_Ct_nod TaxID=2897162 RepID=UPI0032EA2CEE
MLGAVQDDDARDDKVTSRSAHDRIAPRVAPRVWSPPWWRVASYAVAGAVTLTVSAVEELAYRFGSLDAAGRLLIAVTGAGLLILAVRDAVARPALRVDDGGIDLVDGIRRRHLPWAAVLRVRADTLTHNRRGVHIRILTVDTIDGPVLLSRRQLGAEPDRVADAVEEIRLRLSLG